MSSSEKNTSIVRRSKRNIGSVYASRHDRNGDNKVQFISDDISNFIMAQSSETSELEALLGPIFGQMIPHIWFRLLPSDSQHFDTFDFAVGQEWKLVSALFQDTELIKKG